ncbi:MAG: class I SAM-dependent methyltransferase [Planctomycetota bacterium]
MTIATPSPARAPEASCYNTAHKPIARYARAWDEYSDYWDQNSYYRQYKHLGDEWGPDEWVHHVIDTYAKPYLSTNANVLEIGPGGGRYTKHLLENCSALVAVDVSRKMAIRAHRRFSKLQNFSCLVGSGRDLRDIPAASIDFAFSMNVFVQIEIEDFYSYLLELKRTLKIGGNAAIHYAVFSNEEGWNYFNSQREKWSADPCQRARFTVMTLATADLLAQRAGLAVVRNQYCGRDAMMILQNCADGELKTTTHGTMRRDYQQIDRYIDELAADVYHEIPTEHHTAAARETVDQYLLNLDFNDAIELGCGAAPTLDRLAELGKKTRGVSLGFEPCAHPVVHADMQFSGLGANCSDLVIARHVLEHSPMPLLMLMEMARITRKYALVVVPCDEEIWVNWANHYSVFGKPAWRRLFNRAGFELLQEGEGRLEPNSAEWRFLLKKK